MECSRYIEPLRTLARQALASSSAAPVRVQSRERSVRLGAAAVRLVLDGQAARVEAFTDAADELAAVLREHGRRPVRFVDTLGFSRPFYYPLLIHLHLNPIHRCDRLIAAVCDAMGDLAAPEEPESAAMTLWWALCLDEAAEAANRDDLRRHVRQVAQAIVDAPGEGGALHRRAALDEPLDAWTFRELVGLHALGWLAIRTGDAGWWRRLHEATLFHQGHTQPDYTTYQPWGCFAFLCRPDTAPFGEQQLHDTVTQLHVEGGGAGTVPALLLVDAAAAMSLAAATIG